MDVEFRNAVFCDDRNSSRGPACTYTFPGVVHSAMQESAAPQKMAKSGTSRGPAANPRRLNPELQTLHPTP